jgi:putative endonuclease
VTSRRRLLGVEGEAAAARWYQAHGYEVVARNWRCAEGELDLVAKRGSTLVFCEVKTRSSDRFGSPAEAVTFARQRRLRGAALRYLASGESRAKHLRFDVAEVRDGVVRVIEAAF